MKIRYALPALVAVTALALTGCTNNDSGRDESPTSSVAGDIQPDEAAIALLPDDLKSGGVLHVGTDAETPPNEYKNDAGEVVGWNVDLTNAIAAKLGLTPEWEILPFDGIIPRVQEGVVHIGASTFSDTAERQKSVDFVNYYASGTQWGTAMDSGFDPSDPCGATVSVQAGTIQQTQLLPEFSKVCTDAGKPGVTILPFETNGEAVNAVVAGSADAMSAESLVILDAASQLPDQFEAVGETYNTTLYGYALGKGSGTTKAVQAALQSLMDDGTYMKILTEVGIESGAVDSATINAGA